MTIRHGRHAIIKVNAVDLSTHTNMTDFNDGVDVEDVTCYGATRKAYGSGLGDGIITISGVYDDGAAGPRATLKPLMAAGAAVPFLFWPEGAGAGKAQSSVNVIVKSYKESAPVAGHIKWSSDLQMTGTLNEADQA